MGVQIQGKIRKDQQEYDGLGAIADDLIEAPLRRRLCVVEVEVVDYKVDVANGGIRTPKVRVTRIEPMEADSGMHARKLLDEAYAARTGKTAPSPTLFDDEDQGAGDDGPDDGSEVGPEFSAREPVTPPAKRTQRAHRA